MTPTFDLDGKSAVVVTRHGKEKLIEPALAGLGLRFLPKPLVDTDQYGTFTRKIGRAASQRNAVLAKAQAGLDLVPDADFALASEGAFGPHPHIPFVPSGLEMIALLERKSGKAVIGRHLTIATNFMHTVARSWVDVEAFAGRIGLAGQAMLVMESRHGPVLATEPIDEDVLKTVCESGIETSGSVWLEVDMRADMNPARMDAIAAAAADLVRRLEARCPRCHHPDWTARLRSGRPCACCSGPTIEAFVEEYFCEHCGHFDERPIDPERKGEPAQCTYCNP